MTPITDVRKWTASPSSHSAHSGDPFNVVMLLRGEAFGFDFAAGPLADFFLTMMRTLPGMRRFRRRTDSIPINIKKQPRGGLTPRHFWVYLGCRPGMAR